MCGGSYCSDCSIARSGFVPHAGCRGFRCSAAHLGSGAGIEALTLSVSPRVSLARYKAVLASTAVIQARAACATNLRPVSDGINADTPGRTKRLLKASITLVAFSFRSTLIARNARLNSSRIFNVRNAFPSSVRQCTNGFALASSFSTAVFRSACAAFGAPAC